MVTSGTGRKRRSQIMLDDDLYDRLSQAADAQNRSVSSLVREAVAQWLDRNTPPNALIAAHDIGAMGYFARRPPLDLAGLISMLATQALFALGVLQVKGEEPREPDLELARYNIDMLQALEDKTKGNLTPEEQELLKNTLSDLRMGYVNISNQLGSQP